MYQRLKDYFNGPGAAEVTAAIEWHQQNKLTPDIWKLEQSRYQLIFVPDDMMRGMKNSHLISEAGKDGDIPLHPSCFTLEKFTFWKKDLGVESFPIPLVKEFTPTNWLRTPAVPAKIKGELYAIDSVRIKLLDIHRQNGVLFDRVRSMITLPYMHVQFDANKPVPKISREYLRSVEAWMYVGKPEYWDNLIGDMFQVREVIQYEFDQPKFWCERFYKYK